MLVALRLGAGGHCGPFRPFPRRVDGQIDGEARAVAGLRFGKDIAARLLHDSIDGRKAKARPLAHFLGGEERLEDVRSEEHTSELQSLMRISYAVFCLKQKKKHHKTQ